MAWNIAPPLVFGPFELVSEHTLDLTHAMGIFEIEKRKIWRICTQIVYK